MVGLSKTAIWDNVTILPHVNIKQCHSELSQSGLATLYRYTSLVRLDSTVCIQDHFVFKLAQDPLQVGSCNFQGYGYLALFCEPSSQVVTFMSSFNATWG